jgi:hypothetical protein
LLGVDLLLDTTGQAYGYAGDNPVNASDPSGLCLVEAWGQCIVPDATDVGNAIGAAGSAVASLYYGSGTVAYAPGAEGTPQDIQRLRDRRAQDPAHYGWALPYLDEAYMAYAGDALNTLADSHASAACRASRLHRPPRQCRVRAGRRRLPRHQLETARLTEVQFRFREGT